MGQYSSISRFGKTEDLDLHIQRGFVQGHKAINKFGYATSVSSSEVAVFNGGLAYVYATTAAPLLVVGTSTVDVSSAITIEGLDVNYNEISTVVTINGTTTVTTTDSFIRVNRAFVSNDAEPTSSIRILNSDGNLNSEIAAEENQSLQAVYTIPAGYTGYLEQIAANTATEVANKFVRVRLKVREFGGVFKTKAKFTIARGSYEEIYKFPLPIPEKSDIEVTAESSSGVNEVSAVFAILLIKNEIEE